MERYSLVGRWLCWILALRLGIWDVWVWTRVVGVVNIGYMCVFSHKDKCVWLSHDWEIRHCVFREACVNGGCMHCELGAAAFVRACVFGGGATGNTVWVIGVVTFTDGEWSGAVGALFCIYTMLVYMTHLLHWMGS